MARRTPYSGRWRTYNYHDRYSASEAARRRHIEEARQFSQEMGGSDEDVKQYFFSLPAPEVDAVLTAYGRRYGAGPEDYARETLPRWRTRTTRMSGLVARRLFDFLPPRMPLRMKYELAENVWRHFGPRSQHSYVVGAEASVMSVAGVVSARLAEVVTPYRVPEDVRNRFRWIASGDVSFQERLLNHFRQLEKELAVQRVHAELPVLQRQVANHGETTHRAKSVIQVHRHEVHLWVDGRLGNEIREGHPEPIVRVYEPNLRWIWWVVGAAALVLLIVAL